MRAARRRLTAPHSTSPFRTPSGPGHRIPREFFVRASSPVPCDPGPRITNPGRNTRRIGDSLPSKPSSSTLLRKSAGADRALPTQRSGSVGPLLRRDSVCVGTRTLELDYEDALADVPVAVRVFQDVEQVAMLNVEDDALEPDAAIRLE